MDGRLVMQTTKGITPDTKAEAAAWLVRLHADDRSAADESAFRTWLRATPENSRAFEAVTTLWDTADGLRNAARRRLAVRRRTLLAGAGALAAASAGFAVWDIAYAGVYETAVGEQKHVVLSDGTQAFLDTDTRIRERYTSSVREVELDRGRANFHVKPDSDRPFVVEAGGRRIVADRSTLDVRLDGSRITVVLLEGRATVLPPAQEQPSSRVTLGRGDRAIIAPAVATRIDKPNLVPLVAWQTGQAIFDNDTVAVAAAEMNRYSTIPIVVDDRLVERLKLSGAYRVGDNDAFARAVARLLPVLVQRYADHISLVRDQTRMPEG